VSSAAPDFEQALGAQIKDAHEKLGSLERKLRALDEQLTALETKREQFVLLDQACGSLERLDELGAAALFWGDQADAGQNQAHIDELRSRIELFHQHVAEIERQRAGLLDEIADGEDVLDILEDDLFEKKKAEEERKREWIIEREIDYRTLHRPVLPWMRGGDDDDRFRKSLAASLLVALLLGVVVPLIDLPIPSREEIVEVPERFAKLIRQEPVEITPPQPQVVAPEPEEIVPEEQPEVVPETEPEPVVANEPVETDAPVNEVAPPPAVDEEPAPRERVRSTGILAFRDSFSSLATAGPAATLGSEAQFSDAGEAAVGRTQRSMVTTTGPGSSGGINLADISRNAGGGGGGDRDIAGVQVSRVASSIGGTGTSDRPLAGGSAVAGRTDEEIQIVFDRYKSALYRLYNRELRIDPTLRGQIVLRLTIEPDGSVSFCEMQSSDMNAPDLVQQVVERVRTFDFGAKEAVPAITILYPIDFLPAG
jgi:outer membrane biosynthesis protein TonB